MNKQKAKLLWHRAKAFIGYNKDLLQHPIEDSGLPPVVVNYLKGTGVSTIKDFSDHYREFRENKSLGFLYRKDIDRFAVLYSMSPYPIFLNCLEF